VLSRKASTARMSVLQCVNGINNRLVTVSNRFDLVNAFGEGCSYQADRVLDRHLHDTIAAQDSVTILTVTEEVVEEINEENEKKG
jgi:hypothetical protein